MKIEELLSGLGVMLTIEVGFSGFDTGFPVGFVEMANLQAAGSSSQGLPIVCLATENLSPPAHGSPITALSFNSR